MTDLPEVLSWLRAPQYPLHDTLPALPAVAGLYAIFGTATTWDELGFETAAPETPLYVGKSEDSLFARDIKTHFGDGRTGSSTVRRSFAALLSTDLELTGMPRNPNKPDHFSNYGLSPSDDARLTRWMCDRLTIAVWPLDSLQPLGSIERDVLRYWNPPLNISGVDHRWKANLQRRRKQMADQARAWRPTP